jgi:O-antigen/teichoic acid export membrane protein
MLCMLMHWAANLLLMDAYLTKHYYFFRKQGFHLSANITFKKRVLESSIWNFGGNILSQIIRFVSNLIMTRMLAPEMFGLMAIANVFIFGLHLISDLGLTQSLIQSKRTDDAFINTIWTTQVVRGWLIWGVSILVSLLLVLLGHLNLWAGGSVYSDPQLPFILIAIGFGTVISGYESTKLALNSRSLSIKKNIFISIASQLVGILAMFLWVYFSKTVWALVIASLVASLTQTILSHYMIHGKRNHFLWDKHSFQEVLSFGKWIFLSSILGFLLSSSDRLLLGAMVDAKTLGVYAIAFFMYSAIRDLFANVIHNVCFPALSETFRDSPDKLKTIFYKLRLPFDVALLFVTGLIFISSQTIVELLYDNRYVAAGWILQILAISLFEIRYRIAGECYMAIGKPKLNTNLILVNLIILYISTPIAFSYFGLKGIVWVVALAPISVIPLHFFYLSMHKILDIKNELLVLPCLGLGVITGYVFNYFCNFMK